MFDPKSSRGVYANAAALELWGADSLDELLARDFSKLSPAVRSRTERLAQATADGSTVSERWSFYPKGQPVAVQAMISSLRLEDGRTVLLFEAVPVELEEGELRAVEALRHTSSLISLFDADGRVTFANPAAFAAYGPDCGFAARFEDRAQGAAAFAQVLDGEVLAELLQVCTRDGVRSHFVDVRRVTDPVTGQAGVLLSERDVTAQVEAEWALQAAEQRAEVAEAKRRFLANISHELRTPLNSVIGFAALLAAGPLGPVQRGHLERITTAGDTLLRRINDVIDLSELDGGKVALAPAPFDPVQLLRDALADIAPTATAKGLALDLEITDAPAEVVGDAARLKTVLAHYLANAVKFTERGAVVLSLTARLGAGDTADLQVCVADTGPGLDPAAQATLFQRFGTADDSATRRDGGAGLGLAIAKELIALMGGEVEVESAPGQGARFWFRLNLPCPAAVPQAEDAAQADDRILTILYADDHENNRVLVKTLLESVGHRCDTVDDGAQAVTAVRAGGYDLVLMDIQMPVQDGVSATVDIRATAGLRRQMPILALTANTQSHERAAYSAAGLDDCIAKPLNFADLFAKIAYWGATG